MRNMRAKWILLSAMLFSACAGQPAEEAVPSGSPQPYVMEAGGYICEVIAEDYYDSSTSQRGYTVVNQTDETIQYQIAAVKRAAAAMIWKLTV